MFHLIKSIIIISSHIPWKVFSSPHTYDHHHTLSSLIVYIVVGDEMLPIHFSWVIEGQLAGMAFITEDDVSALCEASIFIFFLFLPFTSMTCVMI